MSREIVKIKIQNTRIAMPIRRFKDHLPTIPQSAWVDPSAVIIGDVTLGEDVSVWPHAAIRGDVNQITIGHQTNIQDGAVLHCTHDGPYSPGGQPLIIGDRVTIGHQACLHGCTVEHDVLIGIGATVLDGVIIEHHVMVGAGALVPPGKVLSSGFLYVGSPAKQARTLTDKELEFLSYSATHYVKVANAHRQVTD
jgi:carbonic anhydrase/acetyltransferase-like protein (isoleucine patch superfamily)